jgi:hypothetical protein
MLHMSAAGWAACASRSTDYLPVHISDEVKGPMSRARTRDANIYSARQ